MSTTIAVPTAAETAVRPVFSGRWRWIAVVVLVAGPLLQAVEFIAVRQPDDNAARVSWWLTHQGRVGLSMAAGLLAVPFLLGGVAVFVALTRERSPVLAWVAAAAMTCAMAGLAAIHGYELAAYGLARSGQASVAVTVLNGDRLGVAGVALLVLFLGGAVVGTLTLAVAAFRSPHLPRVVAVLILAFAVIDFALGWGVISHLVNLAAFTIAAFAVVTGYSRRAGTASLGEREVSERNVA